MALTVVALVWRRPDLLVLATPMAVVAGWSAWVRPRRPPALDDHLGHATVREGDATAWHGHLAGGDGVDVVAAAMGDASWVQRRPYDGAVTATVDGDEATLAIGVRSTRWGRRPVEPVRVDAASAWGAFRWSTTTPPYALTTLPVPAAFDTTAPIRPTDGLVGLYRSVRAGEGSEFAAVRPFHVGDRMRRINWPRSLRSDGLRVNATWADQDTHVALVVDATDDLGTSEGVDGRSSSLDVTVRAAGAIAEHLTRRGDRVSLRVFGAIAPHHVPPATGQAHLRRTLDALTMIRPAGRGGTSPTAARGQWTTGDARTTVVLSPLIAPQALDRAVLLARRGISVVVVDTLPESITVDDDAFTALAWRIRLLERRRELRTVHAAGIPVVHWRGPGSLDQFLRDVARRASAPRMRPR